MGECRNGGVWRFSLLISFISKETEIECEDLAGSIIDDAVKTSLWPRSSNQA